MKALRRIAAGLAACGMLAILPGQPAGETMLVCAAETYGDLIYYKHVNYITIEGCDEAATEVTIPAEIDGLPVKEISYVTFLRCEALTAINVDEGNTAFSSIDGVLFDKAQTELVAYPPGRADAGYEIPEGVEMIGDRAFSSCKNLETLTIPDSVSIIGYYALSGCENLKDIRFPLHLEYVDYGAVYNTAWYEEQFENNAMVTAGNFLFSANPELCTGEVVIPDFVTGIANYAFNECSGMTSVKFPEGLAYLESYAFSNCTGLTSMTLPDSLTYVDDWIFSGCTGLTSVTLPAHITEIGSGMFAECTGLTAITIPESVSYIDSDAFFACENLSDITFNGELDYVGYDALRGTKWYQDRYDAGELVIAGNYLIIAPGDVGADEHHI